jgi:hypothetical protein
MAIPEGLHRQVNVLTFTDAEIRRVALNASKDASKIMANLSPTSVRRAQLAMAKVSAEMWAGVGDATKVGIGDAVYNATEMQSLFDEQLFAKVGFSSQYWRASMIAQSKEGIQSLISRKENGIGLSERVYKNHALTKGWVDDKINNGLLLGKSAREIANDVIGFINPNVPGGASYAAMRLGRSEIQNAFHTTSVNHYKQTPWVETVTWNLSGSHPKPDECNRYAESEHIQGGDAGQFYPDDVPSKPHPNCLCFVTPDVMSLDAFAKNFKQGQYDNYIDGQMGCYRVA